MARYDAKRIRDLVVKILVCEKMSEEDAQITADALMDANLCGRDSHGFLRIGNYVERLRKGGTKADARPEIVKETAVSALIDGKGAMGIVAAHEAAMVCRKKALENGMAFILVRNGGHYGAGGYWGEQIGQDDLIVMNMTNTEALVVPFGGKDIALGTNPITIYVPANKYPGILYDVATSTIAQGKLFDYKLRNKELPPGCAVDEEGWETTDPEKALYLTSFGGHKGYGLAVMIEAMTACLSGNGIGKEIRSLNVETDKINNVSYCFWAMRTDLFGTEDAFRSNVDHLIEYLHATPAADGKKVYYPGEIEFTNRNENLIRGIDIPSNLEKNLTAIAKEDGIHSPESFFCPVN